MSVKQRLSTILLLTIALFGCSDAALKNVVTVAVNVQSGSNTCADFFNGDGNSKYLSVLQTYNLRGAIPSVSCREQGNAVLTLELLAAEPGANMLFDDPRKAAEGWVEMRHVQTVSTNRVTLFVSYYFTMPNQAEAQALWDTLNTNIRSGDFANQLAKNVPWVPLLKAQAYQEVFAGGVAC